MRHLSSAHSPWRQYLNSQLSLPWLRQSQISLTSQLPSSPLPARHIPPYGTETVPPPPLLNVSSTSYAGGCRLHHCQRLPSHDEFFVLAYMLESGAACSFQRWRRPPNRGHLWVSFLSYEVAGGGHALATSPLGTPILLSAALAGCSVYGAYSSLFSHAHRRASFQAFMREGDLM